MSDQPPPFEPWDPQARPPAYPPPAYLRSAYPPPAYPPPGVVPGYPAFGYQVPDGSMHLYDLSAFSSDPLVTAPGEMINGWWTRLWKTFGRSWRSVSMIVALTSGIPSLVFVFIFHRESVRLNESMQHLAPGQMPDGLAALYGTLAIVIFATAFLNGIGWSAAMWSVTKKAAGEPAGFGSAMVFGLSNCLRVGGWFLLYSLVAGLGCVCCVLPGLYALVAGSLVVPLAVFRSGNLGDSFGMVNRNFGAALGRIAILFGFLLASAAVSAVVGLVVGRFLAPDSVAENVIVDVAGGIVGLPASILLIIGTLLTYAELRARQYLTTTAELSARL